MEKAFLLKGLCASFELKKMKEPPFPGSAALCLPFLKGGNEFPVRFYPESCQEYQAGSQEEKRNGLIDGGGKKRPRESFIRCRFAGFHCDCVGGFSRGPEAAIDKFVFPRFEGDPFDNGKGLRVSAPIVVGGKKSVSAVRVLHT